MRPQPHFSVEANDFHIDIFSSFQFKYASNKTGVPGLSWRHTLVNHQENVIVGKKTHTVVIVVWPFHEVHLHINIVTTIFGRTQFSIGILKSA